ncbi:related to pentafunctional arom polypeptide [Cephalotrichum gorgonifer]|uniref:Related to pentafunctional arom polypeptide n=1 Tax=Cephalotrichum gorgonifer TaxID=2041049 RepID=A0AAE8N7B0_9PEZI|nr:related to pentafunctional arom polypeptide [Cephalotrichum gorgonifer]
MAAVEQFGAGPTPPPIALPSNGSSHANGDGSNMMAPRAHHIPDAGTAPAGECCSSPKPGDRRIVVVVYNHGQEKILAVFANVLGKPFRLKHAFGDVDSSDHRHVVGILDSSAKGDITARDRGLMVAINAHCVDVGMPPDTQLSSACDYEFLYAESPSCRRDLARFISFILGQTSPHESLMAKPKTSFISTTFPDVRAALPNLDILTVGADAVEIRVDLLKEPIGGGAFAPIPSLSYVGQQVMLLRRATELPLIFTTRCINENGRFPMDDPELYYEYLYRAIQWGCEYIDVELWLPEITRERLWRLKGNSRIMSAFHDFSGNFKWPSPYALSVFERSRQYADIVKMITVINDHNENFELEYFRSRIRSEFPDGPPLSAVNMGETGQFSRALNKVFTPITHPLLPIIAAPGQMSAAEINAALSLLGQLPKKSVYGIHSSASARIATPKAPFYEKCFNELGLPHQFAVVERPPGNPSSLDAWCNQRNFGGAYLTPPVSYHNITRQSSFFSSLNGGAGPVLTEAARAIGMVDTIVVYPGSTSSTSSPPTAPTTPPSDTKPQDATFSPGSSSSQSATANGLPPDASIVLDNSTWRGIINSLTKDFSPSAYSNRPAVVLASSPDDAASALFALKALSVSKIYTVGFKTPQSLTATAPPIEPFNSLESLRRARADDSAAPFVVVSALPADKAALVGMLLRVFARGGGRKVFLDLADGGTGTAGVATGLGFVAYGAEDVVAFTTVETLRSLVGQNVPYSFVRLASGRSLY